MRDDLELFISFQVCHGSQGEGGLGRVALLRDQPGFGEGWNDDDSHRRQSVCRNAVITDRVRDSKCTREGGGGGLLHSFLHWIDVIQFTQEMLLQCDPVFHWRWNNWSEDPLSNNKHLLGRRRHRHPRNHFRFPNEWSLFLELMMLFSFHFVLAHSSSSPKCSIHSFREGNSN